MTRGLTLKGTPHRGTSYMSMPNLKESIQELLHLRAALPQTLTDEIHLNSEPLTRLHEKFVDMASELRLWSFYETQESSLSGSGDASAVQFGAPLVSVKSALLDIWQEDVYAVDSDHAHLASFGPGNRGILVSYLDDLAAAVRKAAALSQAFTHVPLHLKDHVKVEIIGFYEDPDALMALAPGFAMQSSNDEANCMIRLYSTKHSFREFVNVGPDACLEERLHKPAKRKHSRRRARREPEHSPDIVVTSPLERPALLKVPAHSDPTIRPPSPESIASASTTVSDPVLPHGSTRGGIERHVIDLSPKRRAEILITEHELRGPAGFSRPNPQSRKFTWIHLPFNNPVWVRVRVHSRTLDAWNLNTDNAGRSSSIRSRAHRGHRTGTSRGSLTTITGSLSRSKTATRIRSRPISNQFANISQLRTVGLRLGSHRPCLVRQHR